MTVKVVSGSRTIGGNCVLVSVSRDEYVVLDHGLRFDVFRRYYGIYTQPLSAGEMRKLGALPPLETLLGVKAAFISHLHLDHLGSLDYLDYDSEMKPTVYVPLKGYYRDIIAQSWRYSWRSVLVPHTFSSLNTVKDAEESPSGYVRSVKVFHSTYPSYSYVVHGRDGVVVYTGDIRTKTLLEPFRGEPVVDDLYKHLYGASDYNPLEAIVEVAGNVDILVVEGTNFARPVAMLEPGDFANLAERVLAKHPVVASLHPLDLESALVMALLAYKAGLTTILYGTRLTKYVTHAVPPRVLRELGVSYTGPNRQPAVDAEYVELREAMGRMVRRESVVLTDYETVDIARVLIDFGYSELVVVLLVTSEPSSEEYNIEVKRQLEWFKLANMQPYRLRVSGHYYPHEFKDIVRVLKPRKLVPVHTAAPKTMLALFERYAQS